MLFFKHSRNLRSKPYHAVLDIFIWSIGYFTLLQFLRCIHLMTQKVLFLSISITCDIFRQHFHFAALIKILSY